MQLDILLSIKNIICVYCKTIIVRIKMEIYSLTKHYSKLRTILFFSGYLLFFGTVNSQINVPQVQKSLYGVVEATWCGNCGQYGIPTTAAVINQAGEKAVIYSLHKSSSSQLYAPTAEHIANAIGTSGQPYWTLNGTGFGGYSNTIQNAIIDSIHSNYSSSFADVNAGFEWYILNDTIYVETLTKFFNAANGTYNVAVYLSEDSVYKYQSNYDPGIPNGNIYHNHVLRSSLSTSAFGLQVASGIVSAGSTYINFHKIAIDPSWNLDQIHFSAVVWKDNGGDYGFINVNDVGQEVISTGIDFEENESIDVTIFPNPVVETLQVTSTQFKDNLVIRLSDLNGKVVYENKLKEKEYISLIIDVSYFSKGQYFLSVISDKTIITKQVLVK